MIKRAQALALKRNEALALTIQKAVKMIMEELASVTEDAFVMFDVRHPVPQAYKSLFRVFLLAAEVSGNANGPTTAENMFGTDKAFANRKREDCIIRCSHLIPERKIGFASARDEKYFLLTGNISYCTAMTINNPNTQKGCLAHFAYRNSRFIEEGLEDPAATPKFYIQQVICNLMEPGQHITGLQFTLSSGDPAHLVFYKTFLRLFGISPIAIFCRHEWGIRHDFWGEMSEGSVQLNCKTGVVSHPSFRVIKRCRKEFFPALDTTVDIIPID